MALLFLVSCSSMEDPNELQENGEEPVFYIGADLSYVNEMEDCGTIYYGPEGSVIDPFEFFGSNGANLLRFRLWHSPDWTDYSNLEDVKKSISRAKNQGIPVLLDFHYSDTWADPGKQEVPAAWLYALDNTSLLGQLLYDYTYDTLEDLQKEDLLPDIVQVGNEINGMILQRGELQWPIDWQRNAFLINKGLEAVHDFSSASGSEIQRMLHIAQPENALWWFEQAKAAGVRDYEWIGISYYPQWSEMDLTELGRSIGHLLSRYEKKLMIVETAFPHTKNNVDSADNIIGDLSFPGYSVTPEGQLAFMNDLINTVRQSGGQGVLYWEPAWVSTPCFTLWGQGSHWDNATFFDQNNRALPVVNIMSLKK